MTADRSQMLTSPGYRALSPAGRKVLAAIESEVERSGGVVTEDIDEEAKKAKQIFEPSRSK